MFLKSCSCIHLWLHQCISEQATWGLVFDNGSESTLGLIVFIGCRTRVGGVGELEHVGEVGGISELEARGIVLNGASGSGEQALGLILELKQHLLFIGRQLEHFLFFLQFL